jgi:hypothetical protein
MLDECLGDLPLVEKVIVSQFAKIACPTSRLNARNTTLEGFERLLLHYSGDSIEVDRCLAQRAANHQPF